jgi:hypothetical protein
MESNRMIRKSLQRSSLSMIEPAKSVKITPGMVVRREKRPSFADDPVFIYTSQWTAVFCTQEPKKERKCPKRKSLKFLILTTSKGIFIPPLYKI